MQAKRQARPLDNQCPSSILDYLGPSRIFSSDGRVPSFSAVGHAAAVGCGVAVCESVYDETMHRMLIEAICAAELRMKVYYTKRSLQG